MSYKHERLRILEFFLTILFIISISSVFYFTNDTSYRDSNSIIASGMIQQNVTAITCFGFICIASVLSIVWIEVFKAKSKK